MAFVFPIEPSRDRPAMNAREKIEQDGYVVFRQVLTATELGRLRDTLTRHFEQHYEIEGLGRHQPNAAFAIPELDWLIAHPAILDSFREVLGGDRLVFTGNCDAHMNMLSWWHKDTSESRGSCFRGDYGSPDCRVYRQRLSASSAELPPDVSIRQPKVHAAPWRSRFLKAAGTAVCHKGSTNTQRGFRCWSLHEIGRAHV